SLGRTGAPVWLSVIAGAPTVRHSMHLLERLPMQPDEPPARRLKVVLLTDVFPPRSGGSGWSTFYLGKALRERGHGVYVIRALYDQPVASVERRIVEYAGLTVEELLIPTAPEWL